MEIPEVMKSTCRHLVECTEDICCKAGQLELKYQTAINDFDEDLLFKQTNDLIVMMKKSTRLRQSSLCLRELALFCDRLLWFSARTVRLYKKLIQMMAIIEKLNMDGLVYHVLLSSWKELEQALSVDKPFVWLMDMSKELGACVKSENLMPCVTDNQLVCLAVWSNLLDLVPSSREIVKSSAELVVCFINSFLLNVQLQPEINHILEEQIYALTKLLLQCCQMIEDIADFWNDEQSLVLIRLIQESCDVLPGTPNSTQISHPFVGAIFSAIRILRSNLRKDCQLLAGSVLSYLLSKNFNPAETVSFSVLIFNALSKSSETGKVLDHKHLGSLTFGQLSFMHGLFSYLDLKIFVHPCSCLLFSKCSVNEERRDHITDSNAVGSSQKTLGLPEDLAVAEKGHQGQPFLVWLFDVVCQFCRWPQEKFHSFRLLELWYKTLMQVFQLAEHDAVLVLWSDVLKPDSPIVRVTLDVLLAHMDNSVDGVLDSISRILVVLIRLKRTKNSDDSLALHLLDQACLMPWCVRARYFLMAAILEHLPLEEVLKRCPKIMDDISRCLATNYLTPSAVQVFHCILIVFSKQKDCLNLFRTFCWMYVLQCLTNKNCLTSRNASLHLLSVVSKTIPAALTSMLAEVETKSSERNLFAHLAVLSAARRGNLISDLPMDCIKQALSSRSNDLRSLGFDLLCMSPRSTDPLKLSEVELLKHFLPLNMNIDSPPFRKQLQTSLHSVLVRARDASLLLMRQSLRGDQLTTDEVSSSIEFVDWTWKLCIYNTRPGGSFQRIQTALSWARTVLDTFVLRPNHTARKGIVPDDVYLLISKAEETGHCHFFSKFATNSLMSCIFNEIDEISEMAAEILLLFFPWPLNLSVPRLHFGDEELCITTCDLLITAFQLFRSSRLRDCESGAVLCALIFEKSVIERKDRYAIRCQAACSWDIVLDESDGSGEPAVGFLTLLLDQVEAGIEMAYGRPLDAAILNPIQGVVCAVRRCLSKRSLYLESCDLWQPVVRRITNQMSRLIQLILDIFGGKLTADKTAPSFEQISRAIEDVIGVTLNSEDDLDSLSEDTILSPQHQLMNTWCWLNIREACLLLGQLVGTFLKPERDLSDSLLTVQDINEVGEIFLKVLTCCRHRGAIEGACLGFSRFCSTLFRAADSRVLCIPQSMLHKVLLQMSDWSESSVTRRSAGLPLIVQTILANEAKVKKTTLLSWTLDALLNIVLKPLPSAAVEQHDLPQVHAINVITAIVRESSVAGHLSSFLDRLMVEALNSFLSPVWAMRNASMQLFGYLLCKLVGEKKVVSDDLQMKTIAEFVTLFPHLCKFMLTVLRSAVRQIETPANKVLCDATLVPVLSILARLRQGLEVDSCKWFAMEVRELMMSLSRHKLFAVRQLSARALASLVFEELPDPFIQDLTERLPASRSEVWNFNQLHGHLLQLEYLLASKHNRSCSHFDLASVLLSKTWILSRENPCRLVQSAFLRLMMSAFRDAQQASDSSASSLIAAVVDVHMNGFLSDVHPQVQLGEDLWIESLVFAWLTTSAQSHLTSRVVSCLTHDDMDILHSCLRWLSENECQKNPLADAQIIQVHLWKLLKGKWPWKIVCDILHVLGCLCLVCRDLHMPDVCEDVWQMLMGSMSEQPNSVLAANCLKVSAFIVQRWTSGLEENRFTLQCFSWITLVSDCCSPVRPSNIRLSAAQSLQVAAPGVLDFAASNSSCDKWSYVTARLLWTILLLLNDEQTEVRDIASEIVAALHTMSRELPSKPLHFNQAIKLFLENTVATCCREMEFSCQMYKLLIADDFVKTISEELNNRYRRWALFQVEDANPFLEHEFLACQVTLILKSQVFPSNSGKLLNWLSHEVGQLVSGCDQLIQLLQTFERDILVVQANRKLIAGIIVLVSLSNLLEKWTNDVRKSSHDAEKLLSTEVLKLTQYTKKVEMLLHGLVSGEFLSNVETFVAT